MKKLLAVLTLSFAFQAHAASSGEACKSTAKSEGISQLEDQLDVPCDESSAEIVMGPTYQGVTSYNITMNCGQEIPNGTWVYLIPSCTDATDEQINNYINRGDR